MRLDLGSMLTLVGHVEHVDPAAGIEVHRDDARPPVGRVGREGREADPLTRNHRDVGPHPQVDDGRRREPAARESPQLHGRIAAMVGTVGVGEGSGTGQPAAMRLLAPWRGDATSACLVDAVWGEMYMPAKSAHDSKWVVNDRR